MPSLDERFRTVQQRLKEGVGIRSTGDEPVYYFVVEPDSLREARRTIARSWLPRFELDGWSPEVLSMATVLNSVLKEHRMRRLWLRGEERKPLDFGLHNKTISAALRDNEAFRQPLIQKQIDLASRPNGLLFITELEVLHPYLAPSVVEKQLQGHVRVPTVILFPGLPKLRFLGIYDSIPDYRASILS